LKQSLIPPKEKPKLPKHYKEETREVTIKKQRVEQQKAFRPVIDDVERLAKEKKSRNRKKKRS